jgi:hypothetical protein
LRHHAAAGSHQDEEERPQQLGEQPAPLLRRVSKILEGPDQPVRLGLDQFLALLMSPTLAEPDASFIPPLPHQHRLCFTLHVDTRLAADVDRGPLPQISMLTLPLEWHAQGSFI